MRLSEQQLEESTAYLKEKGFDNPEIGIVLGTGLGQLVHAIEDPITAHYNHIPYFPSGNCRIPFRETYLWHH